MYGLGTFSTSLVIDMEICMYVDIRTPVFRLLGAPVELRKLIKEFNIRITVNEP